MLTTKQLFNLSQTWVKGNWEKYTAEYGINNVAEIKSDLTGAYVNVGQNQFGTIVVFKGTEPTSFKDIISDCLFFKAIIPEGIHLNPFVRVHLGFLNQYMSVRKELLSLLSDQYQNILFISHSLGAALSTLCMYDLKLKGYQKISGALFASPRVGNIVFKQRFNSMMQDKVLSYKNVNDFVTYIPFDFLGFFSVKTIIKLGKFNFFKLFNVAKEHLNYENLV
jgi:hypothetical protein